MAVVVLAATLASLAMGGVLCLSPTSSAGGQWDDAGPEGHTRLVEVLSRSDPVRVLEGSLAIIPEDAGGRDVLFVFGAGRSMGMQEADAVVRFVERGGTLVLASDTPGLGPLAQTFGVSLHGVPAVRQHGEGCVEVPVPTPEGLVTACLPSPSAFPDAALGASLANLSFVARTTDMVFFDLDGEGVLDLGDQAPVHAAAAVGWRRGDGQVVAIADADLWRNGALLDAPGNTALATALASGARTVYLDSTGGEANQAQLARSAWLDVVASDPARAWPGYVAVVAVAIAVAVIPRLVSWSPHVPDPTRSDPVIEGQAQDVLRKALRADSRIKGDP